MTPHINEWDSHSDNIRILRDLLKRKEGEI